MNKKIVQSLIIAGSLAAAAITIAGCASEEKQLASKIEGLGVSTNTVTTATNNINNLLTNKITITTTVSTNTIPPFEILQ
jgi:hypothetical protein